VSEAVQLFLARARTARPHLPDDDRSLATAARICRDLDGLPLAIELAAARAKALSLEDIATRLSDRFRFLVSWRRLSPARHRTLREAMDWSYGLLTTEEQRLLARLSVFAGEFTLDAVATICLDGDQEQALSLTERLVGTSLVVPSERGGEMRYRLLDTIRTYAEEQFDAESAAQVRPAHARYFLRLAEGADLTAVRRGAGERLDLAIDAQDNLRRALGWAVETGSVSFGLELATSLERFWVTHDPREGKRWFAALFDRPEAAAAPAAVRANALRAYGGSADISDDDDSAERAYAASLAIFRELDDEGGQAALLHRLAITAQRRGDLARADELVRASHQIHERLGNRWGTAQTLGTQGAIARDAGDERRAVDLFETSLELAREARVIWWVGGTLAELANLALRAGDLDQAHRRARESLTIAERASDRAGRVFGVGLLARVAAERGEAQLAATLWAAVETEDARSPLGGWSRHRESYRERMAQILADARPLDDASRSTLDGAVSLALGRTHIGNARTAAARA
jgi:non-specific serine/threonine protein kinase